AIAAGVGLAVGGRVGAYVLGIAAVVGYTFPIYRKGGKGVAAAGGMLVVLYPLIVLPLAIVWGVLAKVLHKASLATLPVVLASPVCVAPAGYDRWEVVTVSAIAASLVFRPAANTRRLLHREEITLLAPDEPQRRAS